MDIRAMTNWENTTFCFERKNNDTEGVYQWSFTKNICELMTKPAVNTALEIQSTQRTGIHSKLDELRNYNNRSRMTLNGIKGKAVQQRTDNKNVNYRLAAPHLEATEKDQGY